MRAAHNGRDEVVRVLLEHGARPNDKAAVSNHNLVTTETMHYL